MVQCFWAGAVVQPAGGTCWQGLRQGWQGVVWAGHEWFSSRNRKNDAALLAARYGDKREKTRWYAVYSGSLLCLNHGFRRITRISRIDFKRAAGFAFAW